MPIADKRNVLRIGPQVDAGKPEITPAAVDSVRQRIKEAGGVLVVWAVLKEDTYETASGDGFYLHVHGIALNSADAHKLTALAGDCRFTRWYVKDYRLGLENDLPALLDSWPLEEEFTINQFVDILSEISVGGTASKLHTGYNYRKYGPLLSLP